ncbi:MAG: DEAD/DEAH box helicase [Aquifex sp.]|nr:MAG: DEAD/DEAH box helicase [Aquifex sp.]
MKHFIVLEKSEFKVNPPSGKLVYKKVSGKPKTEDLIKGKKVDERIPYELLNPIQTLFYKEYKGGNALVSAPTSAGKSLTAFLFLREKEGIKVFTAPTRSLVYEKAKELRELFGKRVEVRTGEVFELYKEIKSEVVVATYESLALALRNRANWIEYTKGVVIDEIHQLMGNRGWILEEIITFLLEGNYEILGLSATLPGAEELAKWIKAELFIESRWRPVPLERKIIPLIKFQEFTKLPKEATQDEKLANKLLGALYTLKKPEEQVILFVHKKSVGWNILEIANREKIGVMNETTPFEKEEREEIELAFHNADVPKEEREEIEKAFRKGKLPVLVATSTLAYGVNLPADTVIISVRSFYDRDTKQRKFFPDILDILQMEGRAGRLGIKEKGFSYILPYGAREENVEKALSEKLREEFKPYLREVFLSEEKLKVLSLFILGFLYEGENFRKFLERTYSLKELAYSPQIEEVYEWLKDKGYIEKGKLSEKALFCVRSGMPPVNYEEFLRRKYLGLEEIVYVRPLLFTKKFDGLYDFVKKGDTFLEDDRYVREKLLTCGKGCLKDNTHQFLFYIEGLTFKYRNVKNPPGEFSYLGTDVLHLIRTMLEIKKIGDLDLSLKDFLKIAHSVKYGLTLDYSSLGGLKGAGHVRANLLKKFLYYNSVKVPEIGSPVEELIENLLSEFPSESSIQKALYEILMEERYKGEKFSENAKREAKAVINLLKRNKEGILVDDRILFALGLYLFGNKVIRMKKKEILEEVLNYEEVEF